jgi:bacillolysin
MTRMRSNRRALVLGVAVLAAASPMMAVGRRLRGLTALVAAQTLWLALVAAAPAAAAPGPAQLAQTLGPGVTVARHPQTGKVRFVGTEAGKPIARARGLAASAAPESAARAFMRAHGAAFGLRDQDELRVSAVRNPASGRSSVRFQQLRRGLPVVGGELIVNLDDAGNVLSASGEVSPAPDVGTIARVKAAQARRTALVAIAKAHRVGVETLDASAGTLSIFDPRLLDAPGAPRAQLVWRFEVKSRSGDPIRELVLVDAVAGKIALHFNQIAEAKSRKVCDANRTAAQLPCTSPVRSEGQPPHALTDVNLAYDYSGDTYDFLKNRFGRDSLNGAGMPLISTVRYCPSPSDCPFENAFWNGSQMTYGEDYASADDVVGHEFSHGVTEFTSHLFYYHQSGAINESLSDVFGELVDLTNGKGDDSAAVRWQMGEDLPIGAIRDMEDPTLFGDPDRTQSPNYTDDSFMEDSGGVHTNSGVNNKAAFLMTDGGTFNGRTVTPLGIDKVAKIYYELETTQLTSGSDYLDLHDGLYQACQNLIGTSGITDPNCTEVRDATLATQMNLQPTVAPTTTAPPCPTAGQYPKFFFNDTLENPASGRWTTVAVTGTRKNWYYPQNSHPFPGIDSTFTTSGKFNFWGDDAGSDTGDATSDSAISLVTGVAIPAGAFLTFQHSHQFEADFFDNYDGGVVEYSANGGPWTDAGSLFTHGGYNGTLGTTSPLSGRNAFVDRSYGYGASRLNLAGLAGQSVRIRFRLATDELVGDYGWYIDDIRMGTCGADTVNPTAKPPVQTLLANSTAGPSLATAISWGAATDDRTLPEDMLTKLQRSINGGAFVDLTGWTTRRSVPTQSLTPGTTYQFRVQARDVSGRIGTANGPTFTPTLAQENDPAITYTGTWLARLARATASGGFVRPTTTAGAKASMTFSARRNVGVVMPKDAALGTAKVCLFQGATQIVCQTIDLSPGSGLGPRRLVFVRNGLNAGLSYRVEVSAVSGRTELDAILLY